MARRLGGKWRPLSMEAAMRITIGFLFIMTFSAFATFGIRVGERRIMEQHFAEAQRSLALVEACFDGIIDSALVTMHNEVSELESVATLANVEEVAATLRQETAFSSGVLSSIQVYDELGNPVADSDASDANAGNTPRKSILLDKMRRHEAQIVAGGLFVYDVESGGEKPSLILGAPVRGRGGEFRGVVEGAIPLSTGQLTRFQRGIGLKDKTAFFVLDADGRYVLNQDSNLVGRRTLMKPRRNGAAVFAGEGGVRQEVVQAENGQKVVVTYRPFARLGWVLGMAIPERVLLAAITELSRQLFAGAAVALLFCLITVGVVSRRLLRPLKGLEQAARELSAGRFELDLPERGSREVREVARALGATAGELAAKTAALKTEGEKQAAMVRRMAVLFDVSRQVVSALDLNEALGKVVEAATLVTPAQTCSLMIYDEHADELRVQASQGLELESVKRAVFRKGEGLAGWALERGEPLVVSDARADERFVRLTGQQEDIRSYACVPLRMRNEFIGVISMSASEPGTFGDDDIQILTLLANHAAIAIENAHLFRETQARLKELAALLEVSSSMASSLKLQDTLSRVVSEAVRLTESAEKGTLLLREGDGRLAVRAAYGYDYERLAGLSIGPGEGYVYEVYTTGRPLIFNSIQENPLHERFVATHPLAVESAGIRSSVGVPVELGGDIIGILGLDSSRCDAFAQPDLALLSGLTAQAAVAIERAELFERMRELYLSGIRTLVAAVDAKDPYTRGHSDNVAFYAKRMAQRLGLSEEEVEQIELAGLLHDIGKIGIADTILKKPGPLSREERETMMTHAALGAGILEGNEALATLIPLVKHHHEWHDGRGYPGGLGGGSIPLGAAIIAVADAFDTMTSDRPYRRGRGLEWALAEIEHCTGTQFQPEAAGALLDVIAEDEARGLPYVAQLREKDAGPA